MNGKRVAAVVIIVLCWAGMAVGQTVWADHPDNPVIGPGEPGEWDDFGRSPGSVIRVGSTYHMWFAGARAVDQLNQGIGHATSTDGVEWTMDQANPGLTLGESGEWDERLWAPSPAVMYDGSQFHMWYTGCERSPQICRGGYATSPDGISWAKHPGNPVLDVGPSGSWDEEHARPGAVIFDGQTYRMWFTGWDGSILSVGYAESTDGVQWTKNPQPVLDAAGYPGVEGSVVANPFVVFEDSVYHMWYAGIDRSVGDLTVGYAFSSDGIQWTRHRDFPVIGVSGEDVFVTPVVFDGSTWQMWYSHNGVSGIRTSYATSFCCPGVARLHHPQYIPAAALASGAEGSFYQTDVDLNNAGDQATEYEFLWLPRGDPNTEPTTSETFSLGAGMSVRYANVLSEVFGLEPNALGGLALVSSSSGLLAMSRTYNMPAGDSAGTFGQAIPAVAPDQFIRSGERRRILFASENDDLRFNLGCQNGGDATMVVSLEFFDHEGTSLERTMMILPAWANDQLNRVFQDYMPVNGYVDVWTTQPGRSFYCYGSVLDNVTSDPTTILPQ